MNNLVISPSADTAAADQFPRTRRRVLRIVHVVSSFQVGGAEQFAVRLADAQQRCGHHVSIVGLRTGPLLDDARRRGLPAHVMTSGSARRRALHTLWTMARLRPHVAHAHNRTALPYALL